MQSIAERDSDLWQSPFLIKMSCYKFTGDDKMLVKILVIQLNTWHAECTLRLQLLACTLFSEFGNKVSKC